MHRSFQYFKYSILGCKGLKGVAAARHSPPQPATARHSPPQVVKPRTPEDLETRPVSPASHPNHPHSTPGSQDEQPRPPRAILVSIGQPPSPQTSKKPTVFICFHYVSQVPSGTTLDEFWTPKTPPNRPNGLQDEPKEPPRTPETSQMEPKGIKVDPKVHPGPPK